jgi:hypothetical protein
MFRHLRFRNAVACAARKVRVMRIWVRSGAVVGGIILGIAALASAQARPRQGGGLGPGGGRIYNPATEMTFSGTVQEVKSVPGPANGPGGVHLVVRTDAGVQDVHLGPAAYIESQKFAFAAGDAVTVTGSKVTVNGQDAVIAREVKKGDQVLTLRDARGIPRWSGRARGGARMETPAQ